jgi:putative GTP pyrophosphokinase
MLLTSKQQIRKAGEILKAGIDHPEFAEAYAVFSAFRKLHAIPMVKVHMRCRQVMSKKLPHLSSEQFIIAQRQKRSESACIKLQRFGTRLNTMQDIGGVRVILPALDDVIIFTSHFPGESKIEYLKKYDYVISPKEDGYRGVHLILGLENQNKQTSFLNAITVELQVRTLLQHYWATAVEMAGIVNKRSYKTGDWDQEWKIFFIIASTCFSFKEKEKNFSQEEKRQYLQQCLLLKEQEDKIQALKVLTEVNSVVNRLTQYAKRDTKLKKQYSSLYLEMLYDSGMKDIRLIGKNAENFFMKQFAEKELYYQKTGTGQVLFVKMSDALNLKKAYPNFFGDTNDFVVEVKALLELVA